MPIQGEAGGVSAAARRRKKREDARRAREARAATKRRRTSRPGHHDPKSGGTRPTYRQTTKSRKKTTPKKTPVGRNFRPNQMGFAPTEGAGLLKNFGREAIDIARGTPSAFYTIGSAIAGDIKDPDAWRNPEDSRLQEDVIDPQIDYYRDRYVEPFQEEGVAGGLKRIGKDFYDRPLTGALDLWAGGSVAARGASAAKTGKLRAGLPDPLELTYRGATVYSPASPNTLTRYLQRWAIERMPEKRLAARIGKEKSRQLRADQDRVRARAYRDVKRLRRPDGYITLKNRDARTAAFWEAQFPAELRGGQALDLILTDLRAKRANATGRQARSLDKAIARVENAKKVARGPEYEATLQSMRTLAAEAERIYIEAGVLDPADAIARKGLMARTFGFEGESDTFVTHASRAAPKSSERLGRSRVSVGPTKAPANLKKRNRLILYGQGRLRQDPQVVIEHWAKAQAFDFQNRVKDFLASMGEAIGPDGPNPGWFIVNREGKTTPKWWKDAVEGDNPESLTKALKSHIESFVAEEGTPAAARLLESGEVGQVNPAIVRQFYNKYVGPQGTTASASKAVQAIDLTNGLVKTSLIYTNPGYIPANLVGNLMFGTIHQGAFLPANLFRSGLALTRDRELYNLMRAEAGMGPTVSISAAEGVGPSKFINKARKAEQLVAHKIAAIPDDWPRVAAWYFEARKAGFKKRSDQMRLLLDPDLENQRNQVRALVNDGMVDFERLGPIERGVLGRAFFVWPWIRGAARWAYTTPRDRPGRSALLANAAAREAEENDEETGPLPTYLEGVIPTGENEGIPTQRFTPTGVALGILNTVEGRETPGEYLNPLIDASYRIAKSEVEFPSGPYKVERGESLKENAQGLVPNIDFAQRMISPRESDLYPDDDTRLGYLRRRVGVGLPVGINFDEANERARQETGASKPAEDRTKPLLDQLKKKAKSNNLLKSRDYRLAQAAVKRLGELEYLLDTAEIPTGDYKMRLRIAADYGEEAMPSYAQRFNRIEKAGQKPKVAQQAYYEIRDLLFNDWLEAWDLDR